MKLQTFIGTLAESNPFPDTALDIHWYHDQLYDDKYAVGRVARTLAGEYLGWLADPFWHEDQQFFNTQDEAKAWLVAVYQMGDHKCRIQKVKSKTN